MNWYVIYTKSRSEKIVAEKLNSANFEAFCPVLRTKRKWSDRWRWVEEPLFRSYCFVRIDEAERDRIFDVQGVVRYLYHCGKPAIVRDDEIKLLREWLEEYDHESIKASTYKVFDKVILKTGALTDQTADVVNVRGNYIVLNLHSIRIQIKVDLRKNIVEKLADC